MAKKRTKARRRRPVLGGERKRVLIVLFIPGGFCRRMGREARQGETGLVVRDEYFAIRDFSEE